MNATDTTTQQALNRYNRLFNNGQYTAIAAMLAADLRTSRDNQGTADAVNLVTDAALMLCAHPHYELAWLKLATFCGQNAVTLPTIDAIHTYLLLFQQVMDTRADDFEATAKALLKSYESLDTLWAGVSYANGVHGWRGRMAYDLLAAADYLMQSSIQLLMHGNLSYICEKLRRLTGALYEGTRHSEHPELFDFSESQFPATNSKDSKT
jgi:hypothetical protein